MISPHAIVDPRAEIHPSVEVGPFSIIGPEVVVGAGTTIGSHAVIEGNTTIGENNKISHHAVIGSPPQDLKYAGEPTRLEIGNGNIIREFATIHRGTPGGGGVTRVGDRCMIMAYVHVAHDGQIGNEVVLANAVNMAGHVTIGDYVIVGGVCAIHQFVRIGRFAFIGGFTAVSQDVVPFGMVAGSRGSLKGINTVGLKRRGFDAKGRHNLHTAIRYLVSEEMNTKTAMTKIKEEFGDNIHIQELIEFIQNSSRGICLR